MIARQKHLQILGNVLIWVGLILLIPNSFIIHWNVLGYIASVIFVSALIISLYLMYSVHKAKVQAKLY